MKISLLKKIAIILSVYLYSFAYTQANAKVDERAGFKSLKLGQDYNDFSSLFPVASKNPNKIVGIWRTNDDELSKLFDNEISHFELTFDKSSKKLVTIEAAILITKPYTDPIVFNTYKSVADNLVSVLGKPTEVFKDSYGMCWVGERIFMSVNINPQDLKLDKNNNAIGTTTISFVVDSSIIENKKNLKNGF
ncbi:hypothetical protein [Epilithonimonas sp.]|uniref:hypothetical protein n=1 Tax=Epilithonimonas sp. TaxID=2894511 RepID=UPI0028B1DDEC|nr:hypothetical protein [Epilithonimonas sp.]